MKAKLGFISIWFFSMFCVVPAAFCQGSWSIVTTNGFGTLVASCSCVLGGNIYVIGGDNDPGFGEVTNAVEILNPVTHLWSSGTIMPTMRDALTCNYFNGKIYAFGGEPGPSDDSLNLNTLEIFDSSTNTWSEGPVMPNSRSELTSSVVNGKIYLIGGMGNSSNTIPLNTVDIFDPKTSEWSSGQPMPTNRADLTSSVVDGEIYAIGGFGSDGRVLTTLEIFDPISNSWRAGPSMPIALDACSSCAVNGKMYVMGGEASGKTLEIFDPSTNTWSTGPDMPIGRTALTSVGFNGMIYALGGDVSAGDNTYNVFTPGPSGVLVATLPTSAILLISYPNPFSQSTQISFTSPDAGYADISIVNLLGEQIAHLFSGELDAGEHNFAFGNTSILPDGMYECLIRMNGRVETLPMVKLSEP